MPSESKGASEMVLQVERARRWEVEAAVLGVLEFVQLSALLPGALRSNLQPQSINNLNSALKEELK